MARKKKPKPLLQPLPVLAELLRAVQDAGVIDKTPRLSEAWSKGHSVVNGTEHELG